MRSILLRFEGKRAPICVQCLRGTMAPRKLSFVTVANQPLLRVTPVNEVSTTGFVVFPYIRGVTEPMEGISASHNVKVAEKPFQTLEHIFCKHEGRVRREQRTD